MNKKLCVAAILLLGLFLFTACGSSGASTATNTFDRDGQSVQVTVDLNGGWSVDFGENSTYLFAGPNDGETEAAGYCLFMDKKEYDEFLKEYEGKDNFELKDDGFVLTEEDGNVRHAVVLNDKIIYEVIAVEGTDADDLDGRIKVELSDI